MIRKKTLFRMIMILLFSTLLYAQGKEEYLPFAEQMPEPVGGLEAIYKKILYPEIAKNAGIEGKVYVLILINESGGVDDVKILKDIGAGCGDAAVEAIKKVKYKPAKNNGIPVKVKLSMSLNFQLHK